MKRQPSSRRKRSSTKSVLRLPDLELAKAAVLNSLNSTSGPAPSRNITAWFRQVLRPVLGS
jgi:hypothetical protein